MIIEKTHTFFLIIQDKVFTPHNLDSRVFPQSLSVSTPHLGAGARSADQASQARGKLGFITTKNPMSEKYTAGVGLSVCSTFCIVTWYLQGSAHKLSRSL